MSGPDQIAPRLLPLLLACAAAQTGLAQSRAANAPPAPSPNVVVILIDDMGWADIGPFGGRIPTPSLDRMAAEGMVLRDFVVPSAVCSASRAALMTGCYHRRIGFAGALGPDATIGLSDAETTIAEVCKQKGYATACFGKWHLGHHPRFLPLRHGFDEYFGLPYSNDMWPLHPAYAHLPPSSAKRKEGYPDLPLIEGDRIVDPEVTGEDQAQLTTWYTERAVSFLERNKDRPFFLYVPHSMVHVPLFVSDKFRGKSKQGLFGDCVMEIDWSVGQILGTLKRLGLDERTLVLFTSDNGPWLSYGEHAGSAGPLREGKGTSFEGGVRVPTVVRWPGHVPAGAESRELASTIDVLPTVAQLIGAELPRLPIDGQDISPILLGEPGAKSPHEALFTWYDGGELQAVRTDRWKLHFPHKYATLAGRPGGKDGSPAPYSSAKIGLSLFDLRADPGESKDVAKEHPDVVARLQALAAAEREELGDKAQGITGRAVRPPGRLRPDDARLR